MVVSLNSGLKSNKARRRVEMYPRLTGVAGGRRDTTPTPLQLLLAAAAAFAAVGFKGWLFITIDCIVFVIC